MLKFENISQIFSLNLENCTDRLSRNFVKPLKHKSLKTPKSEDLKRINTLLNSSKYIPNRCEILDIKYFNIALNMYNFLI